MTATKTVLVVRDSDSGDWLLADKESVRLWQEWSGHANAGYSYPVPYNLSRPGQFEGFCDEATSLGYEVILAPHRAVNPPTVGSEVV